MSDIAEKAGIINKNAISEAQTSAKGNERVLILACYGLSIACAMLTSSVKAEREIGKTMVRRWKNGNSF